MRAQLSGAFGSGSILVVEAIDGANIVETTAGDEVAGW